MQGLEPEIVPSTFEETLPFGGFQDPHEYPVATATHKAVEVYERLVVSMQWYDHVPCRSASIQYTSYGAMESVMTLNRSLEIRRPSQRSI